jgi:uncharacterized protein YceH (UPF0502 family)
MTPGIPITVRLDRKQRREKLQEFLELNSHCRRVLGALLEKEQTTPDYYPLTLNALLTACNQTTNRNPVLNLKRYEVLAAIHSLERVGMVQRVTGPRVDRWSHLLVKPAFSRPPDKALLTVLLLRGSQTVGELKARTERMYSFVSLGEVEETLEGLMETDPSLVIRRKREPGQKETRWDLNLHAPESNGTAGDADEPPEIPEEPVEGLTLVERIDKLEKQVSEILRRLDEI